MNGKFIIFSAPSGAGKTTIVKHLLQSSLPLEFSISATNRKPRGTEVHGKDYYFLTDDEFRKNIAEGNFIEWEEVYTGSFYGTFKSEVDRIWNSGKHVLFDIDVKGGIKMKNLHPLKTLSIFVMPPSVEELEKRLIARSTDNLENIKKRVAKAIEEIRFSEKFDLIIINDNLEKAQETALNAVTRFISDSR